MMVCNRMKNETEMEERERFWGLKVFVLIWKI